MFERAISFFIGNVLTKSVITKQLIDVNRIHTFTVAFT